MQQTPDHLEKLAESLLYNFIVIEDKNVIEKEKKQLEFFSFRIITYFKD